MSHKLKKKKKKTSNTETNHLFNPSISKLDEKLIKVLITYFAILLR